MQQPYLLQTHDPNNQNGDQGSYAEKNGVTHHAQNDVVEQAH